MGVIHFLDASFAHFVNLDVMRGGRAPSHRFPPR